MKNELDAKIMTKFVSVRTKSYSYLINDDSEDKKGERHKSVCHKKKNFKNWNFEIIKNCLEAPQTKLGYLGKK